MTSVASPYTVTDRGGNPLGRWFNDRKVRSKVLIAVGAVAIAGIVAGLVGVSKLGTVYRAGNKVVTVNLIPAESLADARIQVANVRTAVRDVFLVKGDAETAASQKIADADTAIDADIATYLPNAADPASIRQFQTTWTTYKQFRDATMIPAAHAHDLTAFVTALSVGSPMSAKAAGLLTVAAKAEAAQGLSTGASAKASYQAGRLQVIVVLLVGILLSLSLAL